jgi:hypothetical protein
MDPLEQFMVEYFDQLIKSLQESLAATDKEQAELIRVLVEPRVFIPLKMRGVEQMLVQQGVDISRVRVGLGHYLQGTCQLSDVDIQSLTGDAMQEYLGRQVSQYIKARTAPVAHS